MHTLLLINGPSLNQLGKRDPIQYGHLSLNAIIELTKQEANKHNYKLIAYQTNHEGYLIDILQSKAHLCKGIIINPGALSHYSYALYDALVDTSLAIVEVHLSNITKREEWRKISVTAPASIKIISGKKEQGYVEAVNFLIEHINNEKK